MEGRLMSLGSKNMKSYLFTPHLVALLTGLRDVKEWPYFYLKLMKKKRMDLTLFFHGPCAFPWSIGLQGVMEQKLSALVGTQWSILNGSGDLHGCHNYGVERSQCIMWREFDLKIQTDLNLNSGPSTF